VITEALEVRSPPSISQIAQTATGFNIVINNAGILRSGHRAA
jgi:hypothetical protein